MCKFAVGLSKYVPFSNDELYLNKLFKKAIIKLKVYNHDFMGEWRGLMHYVDKNSNPEVYAKKLEEDSYNLGVYDVIKVSRDDLKKLFINYVIENNYYNKFMRDSEAEMIIKKVCYNLIDYEDRLM